MHPKHAQIIQCLERGMGPVEISTQLGVEIQVVWNTMDVERNMVAWHA